MEGLGINLSLFLAQLINFGVIFFLLVWLLKKPLSKLLRDRTEMIAKSVKEAAEIEARLKKVEDEKAAVLKTARQQADELVTKGQQLATAAQKQAADNAREQAAEIVAQAHVTTDKEKARLMADLADEIRQTVKRSLEHSFKELSAEEQQKAADAAIRELTQK